MCRGAGSDRAAAEPCGSPWLEPAADPPAGSSDLAPGEARTRSAAPVEVWNQKPSWSELVSQPYFLEHL